jgi:hypothetical protein
MIMNPAATSPIVLSSAPRSSATVCSTSGWTATEYTAAKT